MLRSRLLLAGRPALWPTWDPATLETGNVLSADNLTVSSGPGSGWTGAKATTAIPSVGKWYWEVAAHNATSELLTCIGMVNSSYVKNAGADQVANTLSAIIYYNRNWSGGGNNVGMAFYNGTSIVCNLPRLTNTPPTTYVMRFAFDAGAGKLWVGDDHGWIDTAGGVTGNPSTGANAMASGLSAASWFPYAGVPDETGANMATINFGASAFTYAPPAGFSTLLGSNLYFP
jgi:hypothetical protein